LIPAKKKSKVLWVLWFKQKKSIYPHTHTHRIWNCDEEDLSLPSFPDFPILTEAERERERERDGGAVIVYKIQKLGA